MSDQYGAVMSEGEGADETEREQQKRVRVRVRTGVILVDHPVPKIDVREHNDGAGK